MRIAVLAMAILLALVLAPARGRAQSDQTLADIRQELSVLYFEIQKLKRELSTTGAPSVPATGGTVLERVNAIEAEMRQLTAKTEELDHRIQSIVDDGTNRIGDLEFRLVELEGGDVSKLGETTTLGGSVPQPEIAPAPADPGTELAVGEKADYEAAQKALAAGDDRGAATRFAAFIETYPGSPLTASANLARGQALDRLGDTREAARAYLAGFSAAPKGPVAPDALRELGAALGRLGQIEQACVTLGEVAIRFPQSDAVAGAEQEMATLGCN